MSTTVLEALRNAQINFQTLGRQGLSGNFIYEYAMDQLGNVLKAIRFTFLRWINLTMRSKRLKTTNP